MSVEVGAGFGGTVITTEGSPRTIRSGGVVTIFELDSGFGRRDIVGFLNQHSGAVSYASPGCDDPPKLTGNESRSYIIMEEDTFRVSRPFSIVSGKNVTYLMPNDLDYFTGVGDQDLWCTQLFLPHNTNLIHIMDPIPKRYARFVWNPPVSRKRLSFTQTGYLMIGGRSIIIVTT